MANEKDLTIDSSVDSSLEFSKQKAQQHIKQKGYQTVQGTVNNLKDKRRITVHKKNVQKIQNLNSIPIDTQNKYKIENSDYKRNQYMVQRDQLMTDNPNLVSSMPHLDLQHDQKRSAENINRLKFTRRKSTQKYSRPHFNLTKERDLDNDGVPDRIDIDDTRNSVQTASDLNKVGNRTDETYKNLSDKKKSYQKKKQQKIQLSKDKKSVKLSKVETKNITFASDVEIDKAKKLKTSQNQNKIKQRKLKQKSIFSSPLTSSTVGSRTKTQKVILAPSKALSSVGGSLKNQINKDVDENEMTEGVQFVNNIASPIARQIRIGTKSLVSKTVGFDKKAHQLGKLEKKIVKTDKKTLKVKKAQRKANRKMANKKARAEILKRKGKAGILTRAKNVSLQGWKIAKQKVATVIKSIVAKLTASKAIVIGGIVVLVALIPVILFMPIMILGSGGAISSTEEKTEVLGFGGLSPEVLQHEETVIEELRKHGLEEYKDLVLVLIQLESGGTLPDVMQSSESLGLAPNTINNPEDSIRAGVNHLAEGIQQMNSYNVDIQTLIQSYNFGNGFIPYVARMGGTWSQSLSDSFASVQASGLGWSSYGDPNYVSKAMQFVSIDGNSISLNVSFDLEGGSLANPAPSATITSQFGYRIHPIYGTRKLHGGTDFGAPFGTPIYASADGIVIEAGNKGGFGLTVVIDHGSGIQTLYAHNQKLLVSAGQTVSAGQQISEMGSTGTSTGSHLHFEVHVDGTYSDPMNWLQ